MPWRRRHSDELMAVEVLRWKHSRRHYRRAWRQVVFEVARSCRAHSITGKDTVLEVADVEVIAFAQFARSRMAAKPCAPNQEVWLGSRAAQPHALYCGRFSGGGYGGGKIVSCLQQP